MKLLHLLTLTLTTTITASTPTTPLTPTTKVIVPCSQDYGKANEHDGAGGGGFVPGCHPTICQRLTYDDFLDQEGVRKLRDMGERAIVRGRGDSGGQSGPTIVDVNSGYLRDDLGLVNIYQEAGSVNAAAELFKPEEYDFYRNTIDRIRETISRAFDLEITSPVFTAPTFITRIKYDETWKPKGMHDVYWMPHVDKNNTGHYDYSGLLYLTEQGVDFTGG